MSFFFGMTLRESVLFPMLSAIASCQVKSNMCEDLPLVFVALQFMM